MEEEIEILENLKKDTLAACECSLSSSSDIEVWKKEAQAIENLIKGYRELGRLYKSEKEMKIRYVGYYQDLLLKENCIPKSKIREMIEEKQKRIDTMHPASDCVLIDDLENQIEVLQELLEDK